MSDEEYAALRQEAQQIYGVYQDRSVDMTRAYLGHLMEDKDAMEALRQSSAMYSDLGTYSEQNKQGLVGGRLEADHRAMNDMILRSFGPDIQTGSSRAKESGISQEDRKKIGVTAQTMGAMQPNILAKIMDPTVELTPQEQQLQQIYSDFFAQLHGDAPAAPGQQPAAPASAPAQAPFVPGQGPKELMSYRSDEIGALASDPRFEIDPTSSDPKMMAVIARKQYDKLKALQKSGADSATIQKAVEDFKEARARMSWA